jgi:hypothetical protein
MRKYLHIQLKERAVEIEELVGESIIRAGDTLKCGLNFLSLSFFGFSNYDAIGSQNSCSKGRSVVY